MEKRPAPPTPTPLKPDGTVEIAKALSASNDAMKNLADRLSVDSAANTEAMKAIADKLKPAQKIIDVQVTKFNSDGRPTNYRITVN